MIPFLSLTVADIMTTNPLTVESNTALSKLRNLFDAFEYNALPVVEDGELLGWVSQIDLLGAFAMKEHSVLPRYEDILSQPTSSIMNPEPQCVSPEEPLTRTLMRMIETRHRSFPVVARGRLVGIVAVEDILKGLYGDADKGAKAAP